MNDIRKLVKNKELVVRKRIVNFLEMIFAYLGYDFRHDNFKSVLYNECGYITTMEERAKHYFDGLNYLINNKETAFTLILLKKFFYICLGEELDENILKGITSYYFYLNSDNEIEKAVKLHLYAYKILEDLYYEDRLITSLILFNYILLKYNIPCVQIVKSDLPKYEELRDKENIDELYEYMCEIIKNNLFQDKSYYRNLKPLTFKQIKRKILNDKDILKEKYKVKSVYVFGSFCKGLERIDSDIDVALSLSLDLTEKEKEQILKELKEYFYKSFKRFVDIHEVMDIIHQDFIKKAVNIIKIY